LNFGLPAPIDVQVIGNNVEANRNLADRLMNQMRQIPGVVDLRIQQLFDQPKLHVVTDRTKAAESGFTQADVAASLLISLSGSFQTQPTFWLSPDNGVSYSVSTQTPQYAMESLQDLRNIPLTGQRAGSSEILNDLTSIQRGSGMAVVNHYDIQRVVDIYAGWTGGTWAVWARMWSGSWTSIAGRSRAGRRWWSAARWRRCARRSVGWRAAWYSPSCWSTC